MARRLLRSHTGYTAAIALLVAASPSAHAADPATDCERALDAQQTRESALIQARAADVAASQPATFQRRADPQLLALRRAAAVACLGSERDFRPASAPRAAQAPIAVAPVAGLNLPPPRAMPSEATLSSTPPTLVRNCDPSGCWTDTGIRLLRIGGDLWGPRGRCDVQGVTLHCP